MKKYILLFAISTQHLLLNAQVFFSEDFSSGIPGTWTNIDNGGNNVIWRTTTTGALNQSTPVASQLSTNGTSAANGYLILDSDSAGPGITENTDLTTMPINCTGHSNVHLVFNEYFAQFAASTGIVKVSNDNITWVDVHHAETGLAADSGTANPNTLDIDISTTAANQATVYIRFNYTGAYDYWWFVDDVQLYEASAIDLGANSIEKLNSEYTKIPLSQATNLTISAVVKNVGLNATSGGTALLELVNVGNGLTVFSENVNLSALSPGNTQTVTPSLTFAPTAAGTYKSRVTLTLAGDGNSSNDMLESDPLIVSDSVYQRDDDSFAGVQGIGFGPGEDGTAGQSFTVNSPADLTSITFFLKDTFTFSASGTPLFFTVYPQTNSATAPDGTTLLAVSDTLLLFDGMIPAGGAYYTLHLQGGSLHVTPGLYFIGFHEVDGLIPMGYSNSIYTAGAVWAYANSMNWFKPEDFGFYLSYFIRANFGMLPDAVTEINPGISAIIYPNPSTGVFNIKFREGKSQQYAEVFDMLGNCVFKSSFNGTQQGTLDLSGLSQGVYAVRLSSSGYSSIQNICIGGKK